MIVPLALLRAPLSGWLLLATWGMAAFVQAEIFVSEAGTSSVSQYDKAGSPIGQHPLVTIGTPTGVAVDADGNVYVASYSTNAVGRYERNSGNFNASFIAGLDEPYGLAIDQNGYLYVAESGRDSVGRYTPDGGYDADFVTHLSRPACIAVDAEGNLYIGGTDSNHIVKREANGDLNLHFIRTPNGASALAVSGDFLYSIGNGMIGKFQTSNGDGEPDFITELKDSHGLAADEDGNLLVANYQTGTITLFTNDGTKKGVLFSELSHPYHLALPITHRLPVALKP